MPNEIKLILDGMNGLFARLVYVLSVSYDVACGGAFKDSYDILTSYVEQYGIYDFGGLAEILYEVIKEVEEIDLLLCTDSGDKTYLIYTPSYPWTPKTEKEKELTEEKLENMFRKYLRIVTDEQLPVDYKSVENFS